MVFLAALAAKAEEAGPRGVVEKFQVDLISVMKEAEKLGVMGRYKRLEAPVDDAFYLPVMVRYATGDYWEKATEEQRRQLVVAFRRMSLGTLATLFDGYSGETFETIGEKPKSQKTLLVESKLVRKEDTDVNIAYVTQNHNNRWFIVDVIIDNGISELKVRRSEYRYLLKQKGVNGLIAALNKKADQLVAQ